MKKFVYYIIFFIFVFVFSFLFQIYNLGKAQTVELNRSKARWEGIIKKFEISPDNKFLAIAISGNLKVYDLKSELEVVWNSFSKGEVHDLKFSKGSKYLGYCHDDTIRIIDIKKEKQVIISYQRTIKAFDFSLDENFVIVGMENSGGWDDGYISLYDLGRMKEIYEVKCETYITNIKYLNYSQLIAVNGCGFGDGYLKVYESMNGNLKYNLLESKQKSIDMITFNSDSYLISQDNKSMDFWNVCNSINTGVSYFSMPSFSRRDGIDISPDNNFMSYLSNEGKTIGIWDLINNRMILETSSLSDSYGANAVVMVRISPDFKFIYWMTQYNLYKYKIDGFNKAKLFSKIYKDQIKEINSEYQSFKPREEFEVLEDYFGRARVLSNKIMDINLKFKDIVNIQDNAIISDSERKYEDLTSEISQSVKDTVLKIQSVGNYDPDNQTLPVKIQGVLKNVKIPLTEAKSFKEGYKSVIVKAKCKLKTDLRNYEYYDIIIIHPITNSEYSF